MTNSRSLTIDFFRGIAILLVLIYHKKIDFFSIDRIGWIGVDLFFVLSGFLVSGILFKEHIKTSKIDLRRFLIRRGFKIYPLYYLFILIYVIYYLVAENTFNIKLILLESFFLSNYSWSLLQVSYLKTSLTWSLAVEEQFYFFLGGVILFLANKKNMNAICYVAIVFIVCSPILRSVFHTNYAFLAYTSFFTRSDSLFMGVILAYLYYYSTQFSTLIKKYNYLVLFIGFVSLFIALRMLLLSKGDPFSSYSVQTYGHSFLGIGFGALLIGFIHNNYVETLYKQPFFKPLIYSISLLGIYSYPLYLFHQVVLDMVLPFTNQVVDTKSFPYPELIFYLFITILTSVFLGKSIEQPLLHVRDKLFPSVR